MKKHIIRHLLLLIALLSITVLALASCSPSDDPGGSEPTAPQGKLSLVKNGSACFDLIVTSELSREERELVNEFRNRLISLGVDTPEIFSDSTPATSDIEIIFGTGVKGRDEARADKSALGQNGYTVKVSKSNSSSAKPSYKILIAGGSLNAFSAAMQDFCEELALPSADGSLASSDIFISIDLNKSETAYKLSSIKVGKYNLADYVLSYDADDKTLAAAAEKLKATVLDESGISLKAIDELPDGAAAEYVFYLNKGSGTAENSFTVSSGGKQITMSCQSDIRYLKGLEVFLEKKILSAKDGIADFGGSYSWDIAYRYSEFGAKGDGVSDDFNAILKTHETANINGIGVCADAGKTYYIGSDSHGIEIPVKTNTNWRGATFRVDDRKVNPFNEEHYLDIFVISPEQEPSLMPSLTFAQSMGLIQSSCSDGKTIYKRADNTRVISKGQSQIPELATGRRVMLKISTDEPSEYVYVRYGTNKNPGMPKCELIIIDASGNVDPATNVVFDYYSLSEVKIFPLEDSSITIEGGTFINIANECITDEAVMNSMIPEGYVRADRKDNRVGRQYYYHGRGIKISRSNTVVKDITHNIENETDKGGYPYSGWLNVSYCNNTLIDSVNFTAHRFYTEDKLGAGLGGGTDMGSYDLCALESNNITWKNCKQQNSITSGEFWGIMSSNFVKNLSLDNCYLNRFDNHAGAYNASVKNTTLGRDFNIVGAGLLEVVNTTRIVGDCFFKLRGDYGSTWEGDIIVRNCEMKGVKNISYKEADFTDLNTTIGVFELRWAAHDFGYTCYMPQNLTIDNFKVADSVTKVNVFHAKSYDVYFDGVKQDGKQYKLSTDSFAATYKCPVTSTYKDNPNVYIPPESITVTNQTKPLVVCNMKGIFDALIDSGALTVNDSMGMLDLHRRT